MTPNEICIAYDRLYGERKNWDYQAELIERFVMPGKGRFFQHGFDSEQSINWRHRELFDQTATVALTILASSIHGSLTNPASQWLGASWRQKELNDDQEASEWLDDSKDRVYQSISDSNFDLEVNEFYQDLPGFGTGVMLHEEDEKEGDLNEFGGHIFTAPMAREIYFEEDWFGRPYRVYRRRQYTCAQLVDKFGVRGVPEQVAQQAAGEKANEKKSVIFAIYPRDEQKKNRDAWGVLDPEKRPYGGKYILYEGRSQLGGELGYYHMPAYVTRWSRTAGSKFGHSPALNCLSDILTLNQLVEVIHQATEKATDPPMKVIGKGIIGDLDQMAGGLTVVRNKDALQPLVDPRFYRVEVGFQDADSIRARIREVFFVNQLELKQSPAMTATEVMARMELMQRLLGPTLGRLQTEFLSPMVTRCFWMLYRKGALSPMPERVKEAMGEMQIEYKGPLARAQKLGDLEAIQRWVAYLAGLAEAQQALGGPPKVLDVPNFDELAIYGAKILGVPPSLYNDPTGLDDIRAAREEKISQAQAAQLAGEVAGAVKDVAGADALMRRAA